MFKYVIAMVMAMTLGTSEVPNNTDVLNELKAEEVAVEVVTENADIFNTDEVTVDLGTVEITEDLGVEPKMIEKYASLYARNTDMLGYIYLPEGIEYPVMYTPYNQNYYVDHDFNKAYDSAGVPFLNRYSLLNEQGVSLLYGHNLRSGNGFAVIKHYLEDGYLEENKYMQIDTLYSEQTYEVVAVALTSLHEPFEYYKYVGNLNERDFNTWQTNFESYCVKGTLSELTCEDTIIELNTCFYHKEDGRLVVVLKAV